MGLNAKHFILIIFGLSLISVSYEAAAQSRPLAKKAKKKVVARKKTKALKITTITFSDDGSKTIKTRKPSAIDRAIKSNSKSKFKKEKKLVGMNYDTKNPEEIQFDPLKPSPRKKQVKGGSMPEKSNVPVDPSVNNPNVIGSTAQLPQNKSDSEIISAYQKSAKSSLDDDYL